MFRTAFPLLMIFTCVSFGCDRSRPSPPLPPLLSANALACRVAATQSDDIEFLNWAAGEKGRAVAQEGKIVGEWVPIRDPALTELDKGELALLVTRKSGSRQELLLICSDHDLSGKHVAVVTPLGLDQNGQPTIAVHLTEQGERHAIELTSENASRMMAIVVGDEVCKIAKIERAIRESFTIRSPSQAESDRVLESLRRNELTK